MRSCGQYASSQFPSRRTVPCLFEPSALDRRGRSYAIGEQEPVPRGDSDPPKGLPWPEAFRRSSNSVWATSSALVQLRVCAKITSGFWRERRRARCEAPACRGGAGRQGRECIPCDTRPTEQRSRWPGAAPPRRAGGLGRAGGVAPRSQTARVCSLVAPCQPAQSPPAKSELIFAQTLTS